MAITYKSDMFDIGGGKQGAPQLAKRVFNVKDNYSWTLTDKGSDLRKYVPTLRMTEYNLKYSGELNAIRSTINATLESKAAQALAAGTIAYAAQQTTNGIGAGLQAVAPVLASKGYTGAAAVANTTGGALQSNLSRVIAAGLGAFAGTELPGTLASFTGSNALQPYANLYPATETGVTYTLPYLNIENFTDVGGAWRPVDLNKLGTSLSNLAQAGFTELPGLAFGAAGEKFGENLAKASGEILKGLQNAANLEFALRYPGAATETIKKFTPKEDGDTINVVFYLYNTTSPKDIVANWEFLYYLTYQNLPNRRSLNLLDPPCVYDIEVPGYKRFPIAVVESLTVTNEGTTRLINITNGEITSLEQTNDPTTVKMVPEAYKVTIKFKSLLTNTRNLFIYNNDPSQKVSVFGPGSAIIDALQEELNNPKPTTPPPPPPGGYKSIVGRGAFG